MNIRDAAADDLSGIMVLERASFPTDAWSEATMREELTSEHTQYVVLVDEDDVIRGYAGLRALHGAPDGDVQTIAVAADARGGGAGRRLLRTLLGRAAEAHVREVFLDVRDDNVTARALYASEGFIEIGRRSGYYQPDDVDAVVMRLELTPAVKETLV